MKLIYLSQPEARDKFEEVRLIRQKIMEVLKSRTIVLDQNHQYRFCNHWHYPEEKTRHIHTVDFKNALVNMKLRIDGMKAADHYIFLEDWNHFPECKIDRDILDTYGIHNLIVFKMIKGELQLAEH